MRWRRRLTPPVLPSLLLAVNPLQYVKVVNACLNYFCDHVTRITAAVLVRKRWVGDLNTAPVLSHQLHHSSRPHLGACVVPQREAEVRAGT